MMKCVRRDGTASFRALNQVRVQRVSRTPLLGIPCKKIVVSYQAVISRVELSY